MSSDNKVHGEMTVRPPLNWKQIRQFNEAKFGNRNPMSGSLRLVIEEFAEDTDEGQVVIKQCQEIYTHGMDNAWGVPEALMHLAKIAPNNEFCGDFTIVTEYPEFSENPGYAEAARYSISDGKLYRYTPTVTWGDMEEVK